MDVTPSDKMYEAMRRIADVLIGPPPLDIETTPAANRRREERMEFMSLMHTFVAMTMREGARRAFEERGMPTAPAPMKGTH